MGQPIKEAVGVGTKQKVDVIDEKTQPGGVQVVDFNAAAVEALPAINRRAAVRVQDERRAPGFERGKLRPCAWGISAKERQPALLVRHRYARPVRLETVGLFHRFG